MLCGTVMLFTPSTAGISGKSAGEMPMKLNSLRPHLTLTFMLASEETVTIPSPRRRSISPRKRAPTTIEPFSATSASMRV